MPRKTPDPEWFGIVQVGDVLRWPSGDLRVVRAVKRWTSRFGNENLVVDLAIRHRSWTGRAYTCYHGTDLKQMKVEWVGARVKLTGELDRRFEEAIKEGASTRPYAMTWAEAQGLP